MKRIVPAAAGVLSLVAAVLASGSEPPEVLR
jgi:hypothetical protein